MQRYKYEAHSALKPGAIRLLKLLPDHGNADLEANLLVRWIREERGSTDESIQPPEHYQALSYNWGPKEPNTRLFIKILAESQSYFIPIRSNLDCALRRLRHPQHPQHLWVDALCINQENDDEKSTQIPLMSLIYSKAESVAVWLGREENESHRAINFIRQCLNLDDFDSLVRDSVASKDWAALSELMRRPWFNRRWIIQEIALAKEATLFCGADQVSWRDFADVISLFASKRYELRELFRESTAHRNHPDYLGDLSELGATRLVFASDNLFRKSEQGEIVEHLFSLEAIMSSMSAFEASDPHDILYAIIWLANDAQPVTKDAPRMEGLRPRNFIDVSTTGSPVQTPIISRAPTINFDSLNRPHEAHDDHPNGRANGVSSTFLLPTPDGKRSSSRPRHNSTPNVTVGLEELLRGQKRAPPPEVPEAEHGNPSSTTQVQFRLDTSPSRDIEQTEHNSQTANGAHTTEPETFAGDPTGEQTTQSLWGTLAKRSRPSISTAADDQTKKLLAAGVLFEGLKNRRIIVDYSKQVVEVCRDFLKFTLSRSRSLDMICRPWAPVDDKPLPSWIPTLARAAFSPGVRGAYRRVNADPLVGEPGIGAKPYRASSANRLNWTGHVMPAPVLDRRTGDLKHVLNVEGFVLDTIKTKKAAATAGIIPSEWLDAGDWKDQSMLPPDTFWRTLVGNRNSHGQRPPSHWRRVCKDAFSRRPARGDLNTSEIIMYDCPSAVRDFLERVQCMVWSRRLVLLDRLEQSLGLVPANAKKGDLICILYGCSVPVVLRKYVGGKPAAKYRSRCDHPECPLNRRGSSLRQEDVVVHQEHGTTSFLPDGSAVEEHYELIGEAYVHGNMDGEAFVAKREHKIGQEKFELR